MVRHNHIGIWLIITFHILFTFLWYSPLLFYSVWINAQDRDMTKPTNDTLPLVTIVISSIILCYVISWLVQVLQKKTFMEGVKVGALVFLGFGASSMAIHYKLLDVTTSVLFIDLAESFILITLTSGILAIWKKNED